MSPTHLHDTLPALPIFLALHPTIGTATTGGPHPGTSSSHSQDGQGLGQEKPFSKGFWEGVLVYSNNDKYQG